MSTQKGRSYNKSTRAYLQRNFRGVRRLPLRHQRQLLHQPEQRRRLVVSVLLLLLFLLFSFLLLIFFIAVPDLRPVLLLVLDVRLGGDEVNHLSDVEEVLDHLQEGEPWLKTPLAPLSDEAGDEAPALLRTCPGTWTAADGRTPTPTPSSANGKKRTQ